MFHYDSSIVVYQNLLPKFVNKWYPNHTTIRKSNKQHAYVYFKKLKRWKWGKSKHNVSANHDAEMD